MDDERSIEDRMKRLENSFSHLDKQLSSIINMLEQQSESKESTEDQVQEPASQGPQATGPQTERDTPEQPGQHESAAQAEATPEPQEQQAAGPQGEHTGPVQPGQHESAVQAEAAPEPQEQQAAGPQVQQASAPQAGQHGSASQSRQQGRPPLKQFGYQPRPHGPQYRQGPRPGQYGPQHRQQRPQQRPMYQSPPPYQRQYVKPKPIEWETLIFQKIMPRLFIFVLIIGIIWGFKAASDYGYITDIAKVSVGFILAFALMIFGKLQFDHKRDVLGQVLVGGSIVILMITTFAMHQLYGMVGSPFAFILNVIWIALGIILTYTYKSEGLGIISAVGGLLVPFLIESSSDPSIALFVSYETILYVLFIALALRQRHLILYYVSAILLSLVLLIFFSFTSVPDHLKFLVITPILSQQLALLIGFINTKFKLKHQAYVLFASVLISSLWVGNVLMNHEAAFVFAAIAVLYGVVSWFFRQDTIRAPIFIANALLAFLFCIVLIVDELGIEVLIGISVISMVIAKHYRSILHTIFSIFTYVLALLLIIGIGINTLWSWEALHWVSLLVATGYALYFLSQIKEKVYKQTVDIGIIFFALLLLGFCVALTPALAFFIPAGWERFALSILWLIVAVGFMVANGLFTLPHGKYIGAGILGFTLLKIILVDIHTVSLPVRALMFVVLGLVGLLMSRIYYGKDKGS